METKVTVEELRKRAQLLGIKNAKLYKKVELLALVEEKTRIKRDIEDVKKLSSDFIEIDNLFNQNFIGIFRSNTNEFIITLTDKEALEKAIMTLNTCGFFVTSIDNFLNKISFIKEKVTIYKTKLDKPKGEQSKEIARLLTEHPNWSHYKISKILNCTYTNVRRVWLLYIKDKVEDKRIFKTKKN